MPHRGNQVVPLPESDSLRCPPLLVLYIFFCKYRKSLIFSVDPYTCLVSGMQGLVLSNPPGGFTPPNLQPAAGANVFPNPYGYQIFGMPSFPGSSGPASLTPLETPVVGGNGSNGGGGGGSNSLPPGASLEEQSIATSAPPPSLPPSDKGPAESN